MRGQRQYLSSSELEALPTLPVNLEVNGGSGTNIFNIGGKIERYKPETLGHTSNRKTPRTDAFEKELLGIWLTIGRRPVPYAFRTANGDQRSMDAGCLVVLLKSDPAELRAILDEEGYIVAVEPLGPLLARYKDLVEANLHKRVAAGEAEMHPPGGDIDQKTGGNDEPLGFDPRKPVDRRRKAESLRVIRDGARAFRKEILQNWGYSCAVTCVKVVSVLEAAHIFPYGGDNTNNPRNGILLRADLHKLFDKYLLSLSYDGDALVFHVSNRLSQSPYWQLNGRRIGKDKLPDRQPDPKVVSYHYNLFCKAQNSN